MARPIFNSITIATRIELGPCEKKEKNMSKSLLIVIKNSLKNNNLCNKKVVYR